MSSITLIDESTRPKAPKIPGITPEQKARGGHLALIHRMHLQEIGAARRVMQAVEAGEAEADTLGEAVSDLQITRNYQQFGTLCGQECYALTFHHTAEDRQIFPVLMEQGDEGLKKVVARLMEEHKVVHALLEELAERANTLIETPGPDAFSALKQTFETLEQVVRSHFSYEQTELEEALGYYGVI